MNKSELISHVMESAGLGKAEATAAVNAVFDGITRSLTNGESVRLIGFGTFSVTERAEREARNPRTGDTIKVPAARLPRFRAGSALKDAVNRK